MKSLISKNSLQLISLLLLLCVIGIFYWQTVMSLPLFGDATIHGANALDVLSGGWMNLRADYPSFYSYIMAINYTFFGEKGFNLIPFSGLLFLLLSTFLLIRQVTKNYYLALLSIILVACSPKVIFYSARMYQEILISSLFIFSIYLLFYYLEIRKRKLLIILLFFIGLTASIKQQGLFILYPSVIFFFIVDFIRHKTKILDLLQVFIFPIVISLPFYGVLFHTVGLIQPGSQEFYPFRLLNTVGQKVFIYQGDKSNSSQQLRSQNLNNSFNQIDKEYSSIAFKRAEDRHIWPTDVFTNFDKFNEANNLYVSIQGIYLENYFLLFGSFFALIGGFLYCLRHFNSYSALLQFSFIFLPINYILFVRNNDQQRYHLFIPIFLLTFILLFIHILFKNITINKNIKLFAFTFLIIISFLPVLIPRIEINTRWGNSQLYSPSIGGIASIKETGYWIQKNSNKNDLVGQQCGNETHYYSQRQVIGDWETYFLNKDDLNTYFKSSDLSYYVIYESQIVDDKDWMIICWVPRSFFERMEQNYNKVYISQAGDIYVYKLK